MEFFHLVDCDRYYSYNQITQHSRSDLTAKLTTIESKVATKWLANWLAE